MNKNDKADKVPEAAAVEATKPVDPPVLLRHAGSGQLVVQVADAHVVIPPRGAEIKVDAEAWAAIKAMRGGKFAADFGITAIRAA